MTKQRITLIYFILVSIYLLVYQTDSYANCSGATVLPSSSTNYSQSFESGFGLWTHSSTDDFDWTRHSSNTNSSGTGPTGAVEGSYYIYTESSNNFNKTSYINSPCFDLTSVCEASFTFQYHMYGASMGTLDLEISTDNDATWTSIWSMSGDQGNVWLSASVNIDSYVGQSIRVRFKGVTGGSYTSDISLDNFELVDGYDCACTISGNASSVQSNSGVASASSALGDPNNFSAALYETGDELVLYLSDEVPTGEDYTIRWRRGLSTSSNPNITVQESINGTNWTNASGSPFTFSNTSYFNQTITASTNTRYLRFYNNNIYDVDLDAVTFDFLCPPDCSAISFTATDITCGNTDGKIDIANLDDNGWVNIRLESPRNSGNWIEPYPFNTAPTGGTFSINNLAAENYTLEVYGYNSASGGTPCLQTFYPVVGSPFCPSSCFSNFPYSEGFEADLGDWVHDSGDDFDWTRQSGGTTSSNTGPSGAAVGSFYVYTEASGNFNTTSYLTGPCFDLTNVCGADFSFQYHMQGTDMGALDVEVSTDNGSTWSSVWNLSGNQGTSWISATVDLDSHAGGVVQLRFKGVTGPSFTSDISVDDIQVTTTDCPPACSTINISSSIATGNDDAEENLSTGAVVLTSTDIELGADGTNNQIVGLRFNNLAIPQGATIDNAHLNFKIDEASSGITNVTITAEDTDNAITFSTSTNNITNRTQTTSSTAWNNISPWTTIGGSEASPDIKAVIQEVVNRSGWSSGNSIVIFIEGTGARIAESYNGDAGGAISLDIDYCQGTTEVCNGGIDEDGDGDVDCDDSDCGKPSITSVTPTNPTNCPDLDNGQITIIATGANLEYSINFGGTYQSSNTFTGLVNAGYNVVVRNSATGCTASHSTVSINDPNCSENCTDMNDNDGDGDVDCDDSDCAKPTLVSTNLSNPTTCPALDNGQIVITATGDNLEYSIDGGITYQSSETFNGLTTGTYDVVVINTVSTCTIAHASNPLSLSAIACPSNLIVTDAGDGGDANPGDGNCADAVGNCTLRAAIEEANANGNGTEMDNIQFNLPANSEIQIGSAIEITEKVYINGLSQPNSVLGAVNTCGIHKGLVSITPSNSYTGSGLVVNANNVTIRGLYVHGFKGFNTSFAAITVPFNNTGNPSNDHEADSLVIENNIIADNNTGIDIHDGGYSTIRNNFIGLDSTYSESGNVKYGIKIGGNAYNTTIENNIVAFTAINDAGNGIQYSYFTDTLATACETIINNFIGTDCNGSNLGNDGKGLNISLDNARTAIVEGNDVAYNSSNGIWADDNSSGLICLSKNQTWENGAANIVTQSGSSTTVPMIDTVYYEGKYMHICISTAANASVELFGLDPNRNEIITKGRKYYLLTVQDDGSGSTCHMVDMSTLPVCLFEHPVVTAVVNEPTTGCGCYAFSYDTYYACDFGNATCQSGCTIIDHKLTSVTCDNTTGEVTFTINPIASEGSTYTVSLSSGSIVGSANGSYNTPTSFTYSGHTSPVTITLQDDANPSCTYSFIENAQCNITQDCFTKPLEIAQCYYIPIPEQEGYKMFNSIVNNRIDDPILNFVSFSVLQNNTIIFYDHYEDGYEVDPFVKTQSSTEIWGDGDASNGIAPGTTSDLLPRGTNISLIDEVISQSPTGFSFGGRDKIVSTGGLSMARLMYPSDINDGKSLSVFAGGTEVYSTQEWGKNFTLPIGQDVSVNDLFDYVGASVMAKENGTTLEIDHDADGIVDITTTINEGESYLVNGTPHSQSVEVGVPLNMGATITASSPIQVNLFSGDTLELYEARWFSLTPNEQWSNSYLSPVATLDGYIDTSQTYIHIYNPHNTAINVNWETEGKVAQPTITIPAKSKTHIITPDSSGVHLYSNDGNFFALATIDADFSDPSDHTTNNSAHDWGFTLIPEDQLYNQVVSVYFAEGDDPFAKICRSAYSFENIEKENGSPVWITANHPTGQTGANTVDIAVDYNGNGGQLSDANGTRYDTLITLTILESKKIYDPDGDQTGMRIWVEDGSDVLLAAAWGQDPEIASPSSPAMDFGYTISSGLAMSSTKSHTFDIDNNNDGKLASGDQASFSILIHNIGNQPLSSISIIDTLPDALRYKSNSTVIEYCNTSTSIVDQTGDNSEFPLDEVGYTLPTAINPGESVKITYQVVLEELGGCKSDSTINIAYISDGTKKIKAENQIELVPCICVNEAVQELSICSDEIIGEIAIITNDVVPNAIRFVSSTSQLVTTTDVYASTDTLGIVAISATTDTVKLTNIQAFTHSGGTEPDTNYIYAVLDDLVTGNPCRPYAEIRIIVRPETDPLCQEICDDGIDNNNNGLIDYQDPQCEPTKPEIDAPTAAFYCEEQGYIFSVVNDQPSFTYSWQFGARADIATATGTGPHTIQFDAPTDTVAIMPEVILVSTSSFGYVLRDTFQVTVRPQIKVVEANTNPPTGCGGTNGILALDITKDTSTCVQVSLDGGITWEADDQTAFTNLSAGDYEINLRYCGDFCEVNYGSVTILPSYSFDLVDDEFLNNCPGAVLQNSVRVNDTIIGDDILFKIVNQPTAGAVTINTVGDFEYTPNSAVCGVDSFRYEICDLSETCCATAIARMTFSDNIAPTMTNVPDDVTISCDEAIPVPELVGAFDNCPAVTINVEEVSTQGEDGCSQHHYTLKRTWIASDACGNTVRDSQIIEVQDVTPPQIFRIYTLPNGKKMVAGVMENVNQNWKTITFPINFETAPVVFSQVISTNESTPVTSRIKNVNEATFQLKIQEELANDTIHVREKVAWMAIESGIQTQEYELNAGLINADNLWSSIAFSSSFNNTPALLVGMQTTQEEDPATVRFRNLSTTNVEVSVQEELSTGPDPAHSQERIGYLALDNVGVLIDQVGKPIGEIGKVNIDHNWVTISTEHAYYNPVVITSGISNNEGDPVTIRVSQVQPDSFRIRLEEWAYEDGSHLAEDISYMIIEGSIPLDASDICETGSDGLEIGVDYIAIDNCDPSITIQYEESQVVSGAEIQTVRTWFVEDECGNTNGYSQIVVCEGIQLRLKALLQGAMVENEEDGMMRDELREKGLLPTLEPYSERNDYTHVGYGGGEECSEDLLLQDGADAIVDWVFVEIRDGDNPDQVLATCSGLIQCDGDVVTEHGDTLINLYNMPPGNYYVALKHRNHIPIVSLQPYTFTTTNIPFVDFTYTFTPSRGNNPRVDVDNTKAIWSGDLNGDGEVIFQGPGNDVFYIFLEVLLNTSNEDRLSNYISAGYTDSDFNMDGQVIYQGPGNDKAALLWNTILLHPDNDLEHSNFIVSTKETVENTVYASCLDDNTQNPCDFDSDGIFNEDDPDDDNDGVADGDDIDPYDASSDTDGDGITDDIETGQDGTYHMGTDSDPLSPCDPVVTNSICQGIDKDADGCFANYPTDHNLFDGDDNNACFPIPTTQDCDCTDDDGDGFIEVCHGQEGTEVKGKTLKVRVIDWLARKRLGDTCGPCQE